MKKYILAMTTCPESAAEELTRILVEGRICACVNRITGVRSTYHWKNEIVADTESILIMKTESTLEDLLEKTLLRHHPYEVPEFIVLGIEAGSESYLDWISSTVSGSHLQS